MIPDGGNHRFYISVAFSALWPLLVLLYLYRRKRREGGEKRAKTWEQEQRDRHLFSSVAGVKDSQHGPGRPLGYMGHDPLAATDEVIEGFISREDEDKKQS